MFEFDSVSVSSFEAESLVAKLTERSADGWSVLAVLTAGSDVVAYLQRPLPGAADDEPAAATDGGSGSETAVGADDPAPVIPATESGPSADVSDGSDVNGWAAAGATSAGWSGSANDSGQSAATTWGSTSSTESSDAGAATGSSSPAATTAGGASWGGSSQQATPATTQAAGTPQVPAGWYADPARRFELRYWDGGAWTEHVSRNGQQYTDPPVA
jgi:hypothetical protein